MAPKRKAAAAAEAPAKKAKAPAKKKEAEKKEETAPVAADAGDGIVIEAW